MTPLEDQVIPHEKACRSCLLMKPNVPEIFEPTGCGGLRATCRACRSALSMRNYYQKHDEYKAKHREASRAARSSLTPEQRSAKYNAYYAEHPEKFAASLRKYRAANPQKAIVWSATRRALKAGAQGSHTDVDVKKQLFQQQGRCHYCACDISSGYDVDHAIPLSRGGTNWPSNIVCACKSCNRSKGAKTPEEFLRWRHPQARSLPCITT